MAYTQADLDKLNADIAAIGTVKSTTVADQTTDFRALDEMLRLRALMAAEIAAAVSTTGGSRTRYASVGKGA